MALTLSAAFAASGDAAEAARPIFRRIRVLEPCMTHLLDDAVEHSPTLRALVARIERSDLIVYVRCLAIRQPAFLGRLLFVTQAGANRFLMIELRVPAVWEALVATAAHELQHAVEIAEAPWITGQASLARHYERTGVTTSRLPLIFDTEAARRVGLRVQQELPQRGRAEESARMPVSRDTWPPH